MTSAPLTPISLPTDTQILLTQLRDTDGKIDRLLPLIDLLNTPETDQQDLGQALLNTLVKVSEELQLGRNLRERQEEIVSTLVSQIAQLQKSVSELQEMNASLSQTNTDLLKILQDPV